MHQHAMEWNFIFTNTDRLVKIFSHYRLGTDNCWGYWTCGWKTKVRVVQPCAAAAPLEVFWTWQISAIHLANMRQRAFSISLDFPRDSSTRQLPLCIKRSWMYGRDFTVTNDKEEEDVAMMSCKQWLQLKRLAPLIAGIITIRWCFQIKEPPKKA